MERRTPPLGLLVSVIIHVVLMMLLLSVPVRRRLPIPAVPQVELGPRLVFAPPTPPPAPPPSLEGIRVGPEAGIRQDRMLELERDKELTAQMARGVPTVAPPAEAPAGRPGPSPDEGLVPGSPPAGDGPEDRPLFLVRKRSEAGPRPAGLGATLRDLDRRLEAIGPLGVESGTGQQVGPLFFDPKGADFTQWTNHFSNETYRNWQMPQPALLGMRGVVTISFIVDRGGRVTELHVDESSGNVALDRAAANALISGHFLSLPSDFGPPTVSMRISFFYNTRPSQS